MRPSVYPEIKLRAIPLDVTLGADGMWIGSGAEHLNKAIARGGQFSWPMRVDRMTLVGVVAEPGDVMLLVKMGLRSTRATAAAFLDEQWPPSQRSMTLPSVTPFALRGSPGARITGRLAIEAI